jgi:hypothetical protein
MALAKCRECGTEVSDSAKICPKCGIAKPVKKTSLITKIFFGFLGLVIIGRLIGGGSGNTEGSPSSVTSAVATRSVAPIVSEVPESQWSYSSSADPMSKGTTYHAVVSSTNAVEFQFPYGGPQHARLNLRTDPRYGKDVIFHIERGQILCHSYEDCTVLVRFDDEQAANYSAVGAADNSTETIFIRNYDRFVGKLAKAKLVRISANIYQQGAPVFEFDVSGFDSSKYKPSNK